MAKFTQGKELREAFLSYFEKQGHARVPSSKLVPDNDPTLLFTNAGMVQFKDLFLGIEKRDYTTATSVQKCVRAGGKHNDLENVGFTERHHTFFEMLGNFSFGDYFKKEAIHYAWEFVTKDLGLPKDRLRVSVYETDDESAEIWHKQEGVPLDKIVRFKEDNFWAMGDEGPCGPCSEIFWDQGKDVDGDRWLEFWNLVFMQYDRKKDGTLVPLKKPSVDTGMGLERMCTIMQGVESNYEIDLFKDLISQSRSHFENKLKKKINLSQRENLCALRVIADHLRATSFLISDGVMPSNEGRGYVLRRILRRAVRFGHKLGIREPFIEALYPALKNSLSGAYPELIERESFVRDVLVQEEIKFFETLDRGIDLLDQAIEKNPKELPPETVFKLYDTFGFPFDLTQLIAQERNRKIDMPQVEALLEKQQEQSRASWKGSGAESLPAEVREWKNSHQNKFSFYEKDTDESLVKALHFDGENTWVILDPHPFYAESGGQVSDTGTLTDKSTQKSYKLLYSQKLKNDLIAAKLEGKTSLALNSSVSACVDNERRKKVRANHTATHLLHASLRKHLGTHVHQAGSYLDDQKLRFDFSHNKAIEKEKIKEIEKWVNDRIQEDHPVAISSMSHKEAIDSGAMALFGEKYGDEVRVVNIPQVSMELCGGLHVTKTKEIVAFKITKESGVSSGVRRIEALTQDAVSTYLQEETQKEKLQELARLNAEKHLQELKESKKNEIEAALKGSVSHEAWQTQAQGQDFCIHLFSQEISIPALREVSDKLRTENSKAAHIVISGKNIIITAHPDLKFHSGNFLKTFVSAWSGRGGGNEKTAQGALSQNVSLQEIQEWFNKNA
jgi:alanyl-tRNA synthetase